MPKDEQLTDLVFPLIKKMQSLHLNFSNFSFNHTNTQGVCNVKTVTRVVLVCLVVFFIECFSSKHLFRSVLKTKPTNVLHSSHETYRY